MAKTDERGIYLTQVQTNVSFTAFMTAVVVFFTGLLLTKFESFDISIKIPVSFLIISIFGFLYSTIIFANASGDVLRKKFQKFEKNELLGNSLSEYFGVYLLVLSIPLVINIVTTDIYLKLVTMAAALVGLAAYQFSHFSLTERYFKKKHHLLISIAILAFAIILLLTQTYKLYFVQTAAAYILFTICVMYFTAKQKKF